MTGTGTLAVWNDRATERETDYENWYQNEHLPDRLGVPGFIRGRRYQAIEATPEFFTWYEVESPSVLRSKAYKTRLANPTPWTQKIMTKTFLNASRTVCRREVIAGEVFGSVAVVARFDSGIDEKLISNVLAKIDNPTALARAEQWVRDEAPCDGAMAEEAIRGPDQKIAACWMFEFLREADAQALTTALRNEFEAAMVGMYRLLCERGRAV